MEFHYVLTIFTQHFSIISGANATLRRQIKNLNRAMFGSALGKLNLLFCGS